MGGSGGWVGGWVGGREVGGWGREVGGWVGGCVRRMLGVGIPLIELEILKFPFRVFKILIPYSIFSHD